MLFVDTNILLYALSTTADEREKRQTADRLLQRSDLALSTQVLQEFFVQATRPGRPDAITARQAGDLVRAFARYPVQPVTLDVVQAAIDTHQRFGVSYWDAAIIEAARISGCRTVLSEDLSHGQDYAGVQVSNPFLGPDAASG